MSQNFQNLEKEDIPEAACLHQRAFAADPIINSIYPLAAQSLEWLQHMSTAIESVHADSSQHLLKISSLDGQLIGIAQ